MKHYLIDSENVGDFWIPLLELPADQAELIVFYTKNSPHMSYDSLIKLKESDRTVTFIKCYEGTNALDFQLCSELGFLIAGNPGDEFIIVTNDTGYDAAVKYWRRKEYSVKRIAGKDSRTGSRRRGTPARFDVAAEVSAILHKLVKMPDHDDSISEDQTEAEEDTEVTAVNADLVQADQDPLYEEEETDPEDSAEEYEDEEEPDGDSEEMTSYEEDGDSEEEEYSEEAEEEDPGELSEDPGEEPYGEDAEEPSEDPALEEEAPADGGKDPDEEENIAAPEEALSEEAPSEDIGPEETDSEEIDPKENGSEESPAEEAAEKTEEKGAAGAEGEENGDEFVPDSDEITAIVNCIGMDNLAELHNQLIQFYGDHGKDVYQSLKSNALQIEKKDWDKEEKFLYYCALIFRHSDEPAEALTEENISEFAKFILGAENKRKNLNSLRYALLKHYGKEKGRRYYFMLKPYVKALNQM